MIKMPCVTSSFAIYILIINIDLINCLDTLLSKRASFYSHIYSLLAPTFLTSGKLNYIQHQRSLFSVKSVHIKKSHASGEVEKLSKLFLILTVQ